MIEGGKENVHNNNNNSHHQPVELPHVTSDDGIEESSEEEEESESSDDNDDSIENIVNYESIVDTLNLKLKEIENEKDKLDKENNSLKQALQDTLDLNTDIQKKNVDLTKSVKEKSKQLQVF